MNININIPKEVDTALNILNKNGFDAYIVGGCVRDSLLGVAPNDWDITTVAKPDEISSCFHNYKTINTGLKHGTVTVLMGKMHLEITTYRIDGKYTDNRRPDSVFFTHDVQHDLRRRDFTINSLAWNKGGIVDLFGGIKDIENKMIKCVGNPDERFNEDGLRILRAMRFASVLGFKIDESTSKSILRNRELLRNISKERISNEFNKLVAGKSFYNILKEYKKVIEVFIPELESFNEEAWEDILNSLNYAHNLTLKLALILYNTNNAEVILKNLKYDNATIKSVKAIVEYRHEEIKGNKIKIKKQLNLIGYENYINLLKFKYALFKSQSEKHENELVDIIAVEKTLNCIDMNRECYNLKMLEINGEDLIEEGFDKGIILGSILNDILNLVIEEKLENNKKTLIEYANKYKIIKK